MDGESAFTWGPLVGLTALFLGAFVAFSIVTVRAGRPSTERAAKAGGSVLLSRYFVEFGLWVFRPVIGGLVKLRVHPDVLSWTSLVLQGAAAVALAKGEFGLGGWVLLVGATCDSLDGGVARARGMASDAGEVLDAMIDRWGEMAVFFGYAFYYRDTAWACALALAACSGAVMVSYTRAKAEALGVEVPGGLMQRHERAAYLIVSTILAAFLDLHSREPHPWHGPVLVALALIAVLGNHTAVRRIAHLRRELAAR